MACGSKGFTRPAQGALLPQNATHKASNAIDIAAHDASPAIACVSGTIIFAIGGMPDKPSNTKINAPKPIGSGRWGNSVVLAGDDGCVYLYAHLSQTYVNTGRRVSQGEEIGKTGQSGHATGPHLHFQVAGGTNVTTLLATYAATDAEFVKNTLTTGNRLGEAGKPWGTIHIPGDGDIALGAYLKVFAGAVILLVALVIILLASGLRSGAAGEAVSALPGGNLIKRAGKSYAGGVSERRAIQKAAPADRGAIERGEPVGAVRDGRKRSPHKISADSMWDD